MQTAIPHSILHLDSKGKPLYNLILQIHLWDVGERKEHLSLSPRGCMGLEVESIRLFSGSLVIGKCCIRVTSDIDIVDVLLFVVYSLRA